LISEYWLRGILCQLWKPQFKYGKNTKTVNKKSKVKVEELLYKREDNIKRI
jgi:hypothetical protein